MKLWKVTNGYWGNGPVSVLAIAESEARAIELARHAYRAERTTFGAEYYSNLSAVLICPDLTVEWYGLPED